MNTVLTAVNALSSAQEVQSHCPPDDVMRHAKHSEQKEKAVT